MSFNASMHTLCSKTASQIEFNDADVGEPYKSLYLDTLAVAVKHRIGHRIGALSARDSSSNAQQADTEGYTHGTLSTAGIAGASPAVHSLTKQAARAKVQHASATAADAAQAAAADDDGSQASVAGTAAAQQRPADPGMRPRLRIPAVVNKPDLIHTTLDIEGAQSCPRNIFKHPRNTDPLNPKYSMASSSLPLPCGPEQPDKLLGYTLDVTDIPGATHTTRTSATRTAQLDVSDIEGTNGHWRPHHRQHFGVKLRDSGLNVADINSYMAGVKPGPRSTTDKGHPGGPRVQPHVKPRQHPADMDNSLRTFDIQGTRAVLLDMRVGARQPHNHTTSVADIEGAAPADRDKVHLFERKKAAAAAAVAEHEAGQAVLSGLCLDPQDLAAIWKKCSSLDRDSSGYLTASELERALQSAPLQLSPADTQRLLAALKDNAGLLNYKKLTQQLKGRVSRPGTAKQPQLQQQGTQQGAAQQQQQQQQQQAEQQSQVLGSSGVAKEDLEASPADAGEGAGRPAAAVAAASSEPQQQRQRQQVQFSIEGNAGAPTAAGAAPVACRARPSSAPVRATGRQHVRLSSSGSGSSSSFKSISHWFGGSSRDRAAAEDISNWRPGQTVNQTFGGDAPSTTMDKGSLQQSGLFSSSRDCIQQGISHADAEQQQQQQHAVKGVAAGGDLLPGWVIGADSLRGTYKVIQPLGAVCAATAGAAGVHGSTACGRGSSSRAGTPQPAAARKRPASAGPCCGGSSSSNNRAANAAAITVHTAAGWGLGGSFSAVFSRNVSGAFSLLGGQAGGCDDMALLRQQKQQQQQQRPRSASAVRQQRPQSASARQYNGSSRTGCTISSSTGVHAQQTSTQPGVAVACQAGAVSVSRPASRVGSAPAGRAGRSHQLLLSQHVAASSTSGSGMGLSERRRLLEGIQQDLEAVRMLQ